MPGLLHILSPALLAGWPLTSKFTFLCFSIFLNKMDQSYVYLIGLLEIRSDLIPIKHREQPGCGKHNGSGS